MLSKILFASANKGKIKEIREIAKRYSVVEILGLADLTTEKGHPPEIIEDGNTYEENARLKAEGYYRWSQVPSLADDAGLEVLALNNQPGLFSARYAGTPSDSEANTKKLLNELGDRKDRQAKFICFLYLYIDQDRVFKSRAEFNGSIAYAPSGNGGFGYDPVFIPEGFNQTLSTLKENSIDIETHRILAVKLMFEQLKKANLVP